jgi:hypothetical protein
MHVDIESRLLEEQNLLLAQVSETYAVIATRLQFLTLSILVLVVLVMVLIFKSGG